MKYSAFLLLFLLSTAFGAEASLCPWKKSEELFRVDSDAFEMDKPLDALQVKEDLTCLKILFQNFYVAQETYPHINLSNLVEHSILEASATTSMELLGKLFQFHEGMYDLHLAYRLKDIEKTFKSISSDEVKISEDLKQDYIHSRNGYVYFKPGDLYGDLTQGQQEFIDYIENHDTKFVLDLRGNGGGDDNFAMALAETLFNKNQKIPQASSYQVESALVNLGLLNMVRILNYRGMEEYEQSVLDQVKDKTFEELIPFSMAKEVESLQGKRLSLFSSKFIVIIDSGCASSCETIVEKISAHPNSKLIGTNTSGALHFSNPMTFQLPNSGIIVRIPTLRHVYENDAPEGKGYKPQQIMKYVDLNALKF